MADPFNTEFYSPEEDVVSVDSAMNLKYDVPLNIQLYSEIKISHALGYEKRQITVPKYHLNYR